jgi:AraC family transcriptional regulator
MSLTNKAIWTIERNLAEPLALLDLAAACDVSRSHLAHAFGAVTELSVMQYVRGRRLSEAARSLATGDAPDILSLALDAGYGSHEAFSRAFRAQFHTTPEMVRRNKTVKGLAMINAMKASEAAGTKLAPPKFVSGPAMLFVGLAQRQSFAATQEIPGQWRRFMAAYEDIPNKVTPIPFGISTNMDEDGNFEYMCGVQVSDASDLSKGLSKLSAPAQRYAIFQHLDHVSKIAATYSAIWNDWLPAHAHRVADGPCLERHLETFDPLTGLGGVEIWIPIEER